MLTLCEERAQCAADGKVRELRAKIAKGEIGYDSGYFDAVKEHLDKLARRHGKNWIKSMAKYGKNRSRRHGRKLAKAVAKYTGGLKEDHDGKGDYCSGYGRDDRVRGDRGQQESVGQDRVR